MAKSLNLGDNTKSDWTLLLDDFRVSLTEVLKLREFGAKKYDRDNWKASMGTEDHDNFLKKNRRSMLRHELEDSIDLIDSESECYHMAAVALRALIALEYYMSERRSVGGYRAGEIVGPLRPGSIPGSLP